MRKVVHQVAQNLNQKPDTIRANICRGRIDAEKLGGVWLVDEQSAREFFENKNKKKGQNDTAKTKRPGA